MGDKRKSMATVTVGLTESHPESPVPFYKSNFKGLKKRSRQRKQDITSGSESFNVKNRQTIMLQSADMHNIIHSHQVSSEYEAQPYATQMTAFTPR